MPGLSLPPFPDTIRTHPLLIIDYELIKADNSEEIDRLWKAATELGFWYLKNHNADKEVEGMFAVGAETMDLPFEEKIKFDQGSEGRSFGYKALGSIATNEHGDPDNTEMINVSKEDILAYPKVIHRTYPSTVYAGMESTIAPFVHKSIGIVETILSAFEKKLGLQAGALLERHAPMDNSGSEARIIKNPPPKYSNAGEPTDTNKINLGPHTDIGSLSFLHNRLGGLQVLPPGSADWQYILPVHGHAICNVGDALAILSGGILRSNVHRVVPPPGSQGAYTRWSVVFFSRPGSDVQLQALEESDLVKEAMSRMNPEERARFDPGVTQGEWYTRRVKNVRLKNRTGPETYHASRGVDYKSYRSSII